MPSTSFYSGPALLPLEAGGTNARLGDATLDGLGLYFQFWLRACLNTKVAEMGGPVDSAPVTDACMAVFPWNHSGSFMRPHQIAGVLTTQALPAIWIWSESDEYSKDASTLWYDGSQRTIKLNWIFPQVQIPDGYDARSGLPAMVGAAIRKACECLRHPDFGLGADAPGVPITTSLDLIGLNFQRGAPGMMAPTPTSGASRGTPSNQGTVQRFYPAYEATITVYERIGVWVPSLPDDVLQDDFITLNHGDNTVDTVTVLERIQPGDAIP